MWKTKAFIIIVGIILASISNSQNTRKTDGKKRIIYKYKKHEKFDFEDLAIEGEDGSPGDLSVRLRTKSRFKNILPYRKNFHPEIQKGIERIR